MDPQQTQSQTQVQPQGIPAGMPMPPTPPMAPMAPGDDLASQRPITPEERQALLDMIEKVKANIKSLQAVRLAGNNKTEILRQQLLKQVFDKLQMAGVDLSSRDSVAAFMANLQNQNPELAAMFEKSMDVLLGAAPAPANQDVAPGTNMINQNETVSQNVPGPITNTQ